MPVQKAVADRISQLCRQYGYTINGISIHSGVPQATVKSIMNGESMNPGIATVKKLCDGFGITLGEFFCTKEFDELEQEIK
ncbi:MAG TPA: helix-turn-helix transcriptional regulator [Clostridia bacterium]|nr:helix-turn-helix transcriptional regulator [Clostridia bacterium]